LLYGAASFLISIIPFIGPIVGPLLTFLFMFGAMRMVQQAIQGSTPTFDDFLKYSFDQVVFQRFTPFLGIIAGCGIITDVIQFAAPKMIYVSGAWSFVMQIIFYACLYGAFLMLKNASLTWQAALLESYKGLMKNALTIIFHVFLLGLCALGSLCLCGVGLILLFIPLSVPVNYLAFASIFEGLDIDKTILEWSSKAREVQTLTLPPDQP
jgi:hypothetical protein